MTDDELKNRIADGEMRRDAGMALAAARRPDRVCLGRMALIRALLESPIGVASIDDGTEPDELAGPFTDGGRWRGTVTRTLIADGLAECIGATRSTRPSRHRGWVAVLRLTDRDKAAAYLRRMTAAIAVYETTPPVAADGVAMTDHQQTTDQGDLRDDESE